MKPRTDIDPERLPEQVDALPEIARLREAAGPDTMSYLVGGAVRDLLLGHEHPDLDVVVEGNVSELARRLGGETGELTEHERFATATVEVDGLRVDLATSRTEIYERPGALPKVDPAPIADDLRRRDFTINAMAVPLTGKARLFDPHAGLDDLRAGQIRVLHPESFKDDPTRALRAARYAARLGFELEPRTAALVPETDLGTVSAARVEAELRRIAAEDSAARALELAAEWGLLELADDRVALVEPLSRLLAAPPWAGFADRTEAVLTLLAAGEGTVAGRLALERPSKRSEIARLVRAGGAGSPAVAAAARVMGADWLDQWVGDIREVALEIDGADLIEAGIPEGPAVGRGLEAALDAKLDGELSGQKAELERALEAARRPR